MYEGRHAGEVRTDRRPTVGRWSDKLTALFAVEADALAMIVVSVGVVS